MDGLLKTVFFLYFFYKIIVLYCDRIYYMYCALREVTIGREGL
jgi:hypothetical protein